MGLKDYMSRISVGLATPPSEYEEDFVVASINTFINNLEVIDNVMPDEFANQNLAPCQLIKKRAEYKKTPINTSKLDLNKQSLESSASGQLQKQKLDQFRSRSKTRSVSFKNSTNFVKFIHRHPIMNRKPDLNQYKGGFLPDEVKSLSPRGRKEEK